MTGHDILNKLARRIQLINIVSTVILIGSVLGTIRYPAAIWIGVLLVGLIKFVVRQPAVSAMRCPWCRAELGPLIDRKFGVANVRFCPACGMSMDVEVGAGGKKVVSPLGELA